MLNLFKFLGGGAPTKYSGKRNIFKTVVSEGTIRNIQAEWDNIKILMKGKSPSQLRQAVIGADKALDNALRDLVPGEGMGERLKNAKDLFDWNLYDRIWKAHKLRNNLVHESGFEPPYFAVEKAVADLKDALVSLGVKIR